MLEQTSEHMTDERLLML